MIAKLLVEAGANLETRTTSHTRPAVPLHPASKNGHEAVLEALLGARANPNARIVHGATLRIAAAVDGHVGAVRKLLHADADTGRFSKLPQMARQSIRSSCWTLRRGAAS